MSGRKIANETHSLLDERVVERVVSLRARFHGVTCVLDSSGLVSREFEEVQNEQQREDADYDAGNVHELAIPSSLYQGHKQNDAADGPSDPHRSIRIPDHEWQPETHIRDH